MSFLAIVIMLEVSSDITLANNKEFQDQFPAWRGAAELVFYFWILSFNILFYERSQINYRLIFYF